MPQLFFESHATSTDNEKAIASGHLNPPLSSLGKIQANELGNRYADIPLSAVYVSDLSRSYTTAEIAFKNRQIPIIRDTRLREWNYGIFNGSSAHSVEREKKQHIDIPFPNGESLLNVVERFLSFTNEYLLPNDTSTILIVAHRATYYALEHFFQGTPLLELITRHWKWQPGLSYDPTDFFDRNTPLR